jgi:AraC-like DNA-binding protein
MGAKTAVLSDSQVITEFRAQLSILMPLGTNVDLFANLDEPFTAEALFDCLVDVVYFVKNVQAQYVLVNRTLVDRSGLGEKRALLGKTAKDIFPGPLGQSSWKQDIAILRGGSPVLNQLELHTYPSGQNGWCLTNKFPLFGQGGQVVGLAGVSQDLHTPDESADRYRGVAKAVNHAREHLDQRLGVHELAAVAGLSAYRFDRRIRRLFRMSTGQMLLKFRMDVAAELLRDTDHSVTRIGLDCGFADQSAFARQFRKTNGLTPVEYRNAFRRSAAGKNKR